MRILLLLVPVLFLLGCGVDKRYYNLSDPMKQEYSYMFYLASKPELDSFLSLPADKQAGWIKQFWIKKDPVPTTDENEFKLEIIKRIEFANKTFWVKRPKIEGWRTDKGRIFIRHGRPDEVINKHLVQGLDDQDRRFSGEIDLEQLHRRKMEKDLYRDYEIWKYTNPKMEFVFQQQGPNYFRLVQEEIEQNEERDKRLLFEPRITLRPEHLRADIDLIRWHGNLIMILQPARETLKSIETGQDEKQAWLEERFQIQSKGEPITGKESQKPSLFKPVFFTIPIKTTIEEGTIFLSLTDKISNETIAWQIGFDKEHPTSEAIFIKAKGFFPNPSAIYKKGEILRLAIAAPVQKYEVQIDGNEVDTIKQTIDAEEGDLPFDLGRAAILMIPLGKLPADDYKLKVKLNEGILDLRFKIIP